ncbi:Hypothetical predicted protein [Mytilus galloprovincialis]|uniref:Reverse transcriptase domain-containing protein n=1 Tax=Mytilus galloprovincialis TaxID=29158 RepID=A0A8B6EM49_MYTGA|nr:Hypothetical predicted protein [Mytilus galloprovincialis]
MASDRDKDLFFRLIKTQRSSSSHFTHTLRTEEKEASTPNEINNVFKEHFEKLAKTNSNPSFNIGHDNLVKLDVETIVNICENQEITIQPVTSTEITKRISILKRKKAGDVEGLTAEHLIYGGTELTEFLILELCIRARIDGTLNKHQNKLQKGFTKGASSIDIALLISEAINEAKDKNECLILITLDAEKAFDVVDHIHLFWKLYHQGINGASWLLIKELYNKTTTQVKSQGYISETFVNEQGVKQGGILSANFYKAYNKNILDTLESTNIGIKIGTNYVGCPTCADDIMLCAGSEHGASTQLRIIENCTKNDRVKINSKKTEILLINKKNKDINLQLFNEKIDEKQNIKHLGIERQEKNNPNVEKRISAARATMYSLLCAGLHGINGINPLLSHKLWRTYVIPRMLYGIEILNIAKTDIQKLEAFEKKNI